MNNQTALDFLFEKIKTELKGQKLIDVMTTMELMNESKKMESTQLLYAFKAGFEYRDSFGWEGEIDFTSKEEHLEACMNWYKETFGGINEK
jgi:hypothetical protein